VNQRAATGSGRPVYRYIFFKRKIIKN